MRRREQVIPGPIQPCSTCGMSSPNANQPELRSGNRSTSWLTCLMLPSDSRHGRHECQLGVLHSGASGRGTHLAGCLISNGESSRCARALYRTRQRLHRSIRRHHLPRIGIRGHRPRARRHCQAQVRKGHRPEVRERIGLVGAWVAGILCYPLSGRSRTGERLGG
jgi:hypothetical protein